MTDWKISFAIFCLLFYKIKSNNPTIDKSKINSLTINPGPFKKYSEEAKAAVDKAFSEAIESVNRPPQRNAESEPIPYPETKKKANPNQVQNANHEPEPINNSKHVVDVNPEPAQNVIAAVKPVANFLNNPTTVIGNNVSLPFGSGEARGGSGDEMDPSGRRGGGKDIMRMKNPSLIKQITPSTPSMLRIKGGFLSDTRNFPYMAAIIIHGRLWCAGTLVDVNWVLTAAHCLNYVLVAAPMKTLGKYVQVRLGSPKAYKGGTVLKAIGAIRHPKFEEEPVPHADIAMLKLSHNVAPTELINVMEIYEGFREPFQASFVTVAGWGASEGTNRAWATKTPDLMIARLKVRSQDFCYDAFEQVHGFQFTADFMCASLRHGTRDVCLFDAGAPAVQHNKLMGVVSFGPEHCGHRYQPSVFIKAFYFRDFVHQTIKTYKTDHEVLQAMHVVNPSISKERLLQDVPEPPPDDTKEEAVELHNIQGNVDKLERDIEGYDN